MSRRAWRILLAAAMAAAVGALLLSIRRPDLPKLTDPSFLASQALPELLQRIRNFHRVITREGLKVLEVSASEASYYKNDKAVEILDPRVVFYEGGERAGEVSAERGRLVLDGVDVVSVEVRGGVLFEVGRLRVRSEHLAFDEASRKVRAEGEVTVEAAELSIRGTDLTVDMVERSVVVGSGVDMALRPRGTRAGGLDEGDEAP